MPKFCISSLIPASQTAVYEHVTGFPHNGSPDLSVLDKQYGSLVSVSGQQYTFQDHTPREIIWECSVEPPHFRKLVALDSSWSDRIDTFLRNDDYTLWRIEWVPKVKGLAIYTQWLMFQFRVKRDAYKNIVMPVLSYFDDNFSDTV